MTRAAPRRRAERRRGRRDDTTTAAYSLASPAPLTPTATVEERPEPASMPRPSAPRILGAAAVVLCALAAVGGIAALVAAALDVGPEVLGRAGSVAVATAYTWALAARTGGRPLIFAALALAVGIGVLVWDEPDMRTGGAVLAASIAAVLGVMATVPVRRVLAAVREALVAVVIAAGGTLAALGFDPVVTVSRFQYAVLALSLVGVLLLVHRLGAGLHGLGRRGGVVVVAGGLMLVATLLYAELIRRYGTPGLVGSVHDGVAWCRDHLGGYPRPIEALLGIPAVVWGTHMRGRRRQGWWVCAFGVALTAPLACTLINPDTGVIESAVSVGYSLVVGVLIGCALIRIDVLITGSASPRERQVGRRAARDADDASAVHPEPGRFRALL